MNDYIQNYYNNYDEEGRLLSRHGQVEFLTTMRYIEKYLFNGARIIEIGAGTGRYSHSLAKRGYTVDAVELVPHNINIFKSHISAGEAITIRQGDARDLSEFADDVYDVTLLLGPLYHLFTFEDKQKAITEALRVTKQGGVVFTAYCMSDASLLEQGFKRGCFDIAEYINRGKIDPKTFRIHSEPEDLFETVRREDIDELMASFKVTRLHFVASDLYTNHMRDVVDVMDDKTFELYLKYHFTICERPDMVGITHHSIDVFRKECEG